MRYVLFGLVAVVALAVLIARPWECYTKYYCRRCEARVTRHWILFIQLPGQVHEGPLCRYWRKHVDPNHVHRWTSTYEANAGLWRRDGEPCTYSRMTPAREMHDIALLKRFRTPADRQLAVDLCLQGARYWHWDEALSSYRGYPPHPRPPAGLPPASPPF